MSVRAAKDEMASLEADLLRAQLHQIARQNGITGVLLPVLVMLTFAASAIPTLNVGISLLGDSAQINVAVGWPILGFAAAIVGYACWRAERLRRAELDLRLSQIEMLWRLREQPTAKTGVLAETT
jgi:hypothetical protein